MNEGSRGKRGKLCKGVSPTLLQACSSSAMVHEKEHTLKHPIPRHQRAPMLTSSRRWHMRLRLQEGETRRQWLNALAEHHRMLR